MLTRTTQVESNPKARPAPSIRTLSAAPADLPAIQAKPGCACGGGCPSCAQAKLEVSSPGDVYEREADAVADQVMRMPESAVQRQMDPEEDEEIA